MIFFGFKFCFALNHLWCCGRLFFSDACCVVCFKLCFVLFLVGGVVWLVLVDAGLLGFDIWLESSMYGLALVWNYLSLI